jgi:hypothetical protein
MVAVGSEDWSYVPEGGTVHPEPILDRLARVADDGRAPLDQVVCDAAMRDDGSQVILVSASAGGATARAAELLRSAGRAVRTVVVDATSFQSEWPGEDAEYAKPEARMPARRPLQARLMGWLEQVFTFDRSPTRGRRLAVAVGDDEPWDPRVVSSPRATYQPAIDAEAVVYRAGDDPVAFLEQA